MIFLFWGGAQPFHHTPPFDAYAPRRLLTEIRTTPLYHIVKKTPSGALYRFDGDLRLEEVDVLGEVERVLAAVADHVRVQDVVGAAEHSSQMCLIGGAVQSALQ